MEKDTKTWAVWVDIGSQWQMYGGKPYTDKSMAKRHASDLRLGRIYPRVRVKRWKGAPDYVEI